MFSKYLYYYVIEELCYNVLIPIKLDWDREICSTGPTPHKLDKIQATPVAIARNFGDENDTVAAE